MNNIFEKHRIFGGELEYRIRTLYSDQFIFNKTNKLRLPTNFITKEIKYYKSHIYPNLTIRSINDQFESKESLIDFEENNIKCSLSIEKRLEYTENFSLIYLYTRNVCRYFICKGVTIDIDDYEAIIEIEFFNHTDFVDLFNKYKVFNIPNDFLQFNKPIEVGINYLLDSIYKDDFIITAKIDGIHIKIVIDGDKYYAVDDFGKLIYGDIFGFTENTIVIEGEYCNKTIYPFKYFKPALNKPFYNVSDRDSLIKAVNLIDKEHSDGYIIITKEHTFKSKFVVTTDYQYIFNKFLLGNGDSLTLNNHNCVAGKIYEIDEFNVIQRERTDKKVPNYCKSVSIGDEITKIISGSGVYNLRHYHNNIKRYLLDSIDFDCVLLDVGSGKGGDVSKWENNKFIKKVIAVDPNMSSFQCSKVIRYFEKVNIKHLIDEKLPIVLSIFFVPWDPYFLELFKYCNKVLLITWNNPLVVSNSIFSVNKEQDKYRLIIPGSRTASNVTEQIFYNGSNPLCKPLFNTKFFTPEEHLLAEMYNVYVI